MVPVNQVAIPPERDYHTAAGFVLDRVGHLPAVGETFDDQGWRFEIMDLDGRRIDKILARRLGSAWCATVDMPAGVATVIAPYPASRASWKS